MLVCPQDEPKRVRCWLRPTRDVLLDSGARGVREPKRVVAVEKARELGVREVENGRLSEDARRNEPGESMFLVVILLPLVHPRLTNPDTGMRTTDSDPSLFKTSCLSPALASSRRIDACCRLSRDCLATPDPVLCHGALNTAAILGHNSGVAAEICCMLTGVLNAAVAAWKAMLVVMWLRANWYESRW